MKDSRLRLAYNRTYGVLRELRLRAASATSASKVADEDSQRFLAASLRGKAAAYGEAAELVEALHQDLRLSRRKRWR